MLLIHPPHVRHFILCYSISQFPLGVNLVHALHNGELEAHGGVPFSLKINLINFRILPDLQPFQVAQISVDLVYKTGGDLFFEKGVTCLVDDVELVAKVAQRLEGEHYIVFN